jgi:hypothetical protein
MQGHILKGGTLGERASEKRVTATKKAVETPGGGRRHSRMTNATRHRRAASRSGGATSAELRRQAGEAENPVLRNGLVRVRHRVRDR